ncbi:MAG TPA: hypothetical protein VMR98_02235 [Candidatus Polarisedimenticolaceae bacterium]|nr:hypothetical protein [Candidatus Polarisedimenticolaceae bacterium]
MVEPDAVRAEYMHEGTIFDVRVEGLVLGMRPWVQFDTHPLEPNGFNGVEELALGILSDLMGCATRVELWPDRVRWDAPPHLGPLSLMRVMRRLHPSGIHVLEATTLPVDELAVCEMPVASQLIYKYWKHCGSAGLWEDFQITGWLQVAQRPVTLDMQVLGLDDDGGRGIPHVSLLVREAGSENRWQPVRVRMHDVGNSPKRNSFFDYELVDFTGSKN